ncbi:unnamed protein product [Dibothriocephalus latus]|uniref:Uncharacterized protein n=1 Tax=Dibothriocephalus latus TaxID=60516 RepID=A0A3P7LPW9_DIBLA|nr:unnamed protein product [Dibothriocephalus latus]
MSTGLLIPSSSALSNPLVYLYTPVHWTRILLLLPSFSADDIPERQKAFKVELSEALQCAEKIKDSLKHHSNLASLTANGAEEEEDHAGIYRTF